jgi:hypothetical protein
LLLVRWFNGKHNHPPASVTLPPPAKTGQSSGAGGAA